MTAKYETAVLQNENELAWFIELLQRENVRSYLEIGSKFGGSLWRVANALPKGSRIVSVDLPQGDGSFKESQPSLEACMAELQRIGYSTDLIIGDSTYPLVVNRVAMSAPFDAVLIDGNHTFEGATADWNNYGAMANIVAFHDIAWSRVNYTGKKPIEVPKLWNEIKGLYRHKECMFDHKDNGIGVLWNNRQPVMHQC